MRTLVLLAAVLLACAARAHVTLPQRGAPAGSTYAAAFRVGHPCKDAQLTQGLRVSLPPGLELLDAVARPGWALRKSAAEVVWTADSAAQALPYGQKTTFDLLLKLPAQPGPIRFEVQQRCENGNADWRVDFEVQPPN